MAEADIFFFWFCLVVFGLFGIGITCGILSERADKAQKKREDLGVKYKPIG